ncbi:unnamed protein product [Bemisia tabaci]|uniref:DNA-directed DNA polymerase n=1 Tax=Bemisia tabaci TaxID=7038 RepID=A0A9N9ZYL7_BEMTA|nr:unnamed protein product [Bemisia tabaci]
MIKAVDSSFQEMFVFEVTHQSTTNDIISFLIAVRKEVITFLSHVLRTSGCQFKLSLALECEYEHLVTKERKVIQHTADILSLLTESDVESKFDTSVSKILRAETEFETNKSQWTIITCNRLIITLYRFIPLTGGGNCTLEKIKSCKSIVNVKDGGNRCFMYAICGNFLKAKDRCKMTNYEKNAELKKRYKWLEFPMKLDSIPEFEKINNISINVFTFDSSTSSIYPLRIARRELQDHRDLFFYDSHFMLISKFDAFISNMKDVKQIRNVYCKRCLQRFPARKKRDEHFAYCSGIVVRNGSPESTIPRLILEKNAVTEIHSPPEESFRICILLGQEEDDYDWTTFRHSNMSVQDVNRFEKQNPVFNISLFSFNGMNANVIPLKTTSTLDVSSKIQKDLLMIRTEQGTFFHIIHDLSRLLSSQYTSHNGKRFYCRRCLSSYTSEERLENHLELCKDNPIGKAIVPRKGSEESILTFKKYQQRQHIPVILYVDFETLLKPIDEQYGANLTSVRYQKHEASAFCLYTVSTYEPDKQPIVYRGPDAAQVCLKYIEAEVDHAFDLYKINKPMNITPLERFKTLSNAKDCFICGGKFNGDAVIDHDHFTGEVRGVAHSRCNLLYKRPTFVPVNAHNLPYDLSGLLQGMAGSQQAITVIPTTEEKYIAVFRKTTKGNEYRFIDTYRFMQSSLKNLIDIQTEDTFQHTKKHFPSNLLSLLRRKCVYPYDYMKSWETYEETTLPKIEDFYNHLNKEELTEEDYQHAQAVWRESKVKNLGEYTDLYVKADCLFLADIFEKFRSTFEREYHLDPAWSLTLPSFGLQAFLSTSKVKIELLTDLNQIFMFHKGVRGGFACVTHRYSEALNKYLGHTLTEGDCSKQIILLDACNLYGYAMSQYLPMHSFTWMTKAELNTFDVVKTNNNDPWGFLLEVDLHYPKTLHDLHADLPFCPEVKTPPRSSQTKLLATLWDKKNYVIHSRALKQAVQHGLIITKIHRGIKFRQLPFVRGFVEKTTKLRQQSKNAFEKDLFKLLVNSQFGKFLESVQKRMDVEVVTNSQRFRKIVRDNFFKKASIFNRDLAAAHRSRKYVKYDKPIFIAQAILDIAKEHIYHFWYDVLKPRYGEDITLLLTDTDSLLFELRNHDFYEDMLTYIDEFDTSDYPKNHPAYSEKNKKVIGKFKEEYNAVPVKTFVGLRAKMYAIESIDDEKKRAKGIKKSVVKNEITIQDYKDCLFSKKDFTHEQRSIVSKKLVMYSIKTKKKSLSTFDDKRVILRDGISSLPHGHYAVENHRSLQKRVHEELLQMIPPCIKMETSDCKKRTTRKNSARRTKRKNTSIEEDKEVKKRRVLRSEEEGTIKDEDVNSGTSRKRKIFADSEHVSKKNKSSLPDHDEAGNTLKLVNEEGKWKVVNDAVVKQEDLFEVKTEPMIEEKQEDPLDLSMEVKKEV